MLLEYFNCLLFNFEGVYSAEFHPKFQSGEWTEQQVLENWLSNFSQESGQYQVGKIEAFKYESKISRTVQNA